MPTLTLMHKRRYFTAALLTSGALGLLSIVGEKPVAQAFDCFNVDPKPVSCPFLKVEDSAYNSSFDITGQLTDSSGTVLHSWSENHPTFTLWHWRYGGDNSTVKVVITPFRRSERQQPRTITFPASESHCYVVNNSGVFPVTGCDDQEDPPV